MKIVNIIISGICLLSLTACGNLQNWNSDYLSGSTGYLSDAQGIVADCNGYFLNISSKPSGAERFWQANNLPKGTTDFVCKDGNAYLPSKVTDCQGNLIAKQSGGVEDFRSKFNLNNGNMRFTCDNGTVTPVPLSSLQ
ncbi:hypothetical protein [Psychrobacter glaciei]|uniref:hypothetical protein n=1 Tax=Psychrobacter glaciei TaxID=619771 RepID=UPI001F05363F|nr:hypothetical protein [Psychrobacter glaciei]MCH1781980.1 hypothetical protein [Psychrobacter glaciei]